MLGEGSKGANRDNAPAEPGAEWDQSRDAPIQSLLSRMCQRWEEEGRGKAERERDCNTSEKEDSPDRKENVSTIKSVVKKVSLARRNARK